MPNSDFSTASLGCKGISVWRPTKLNWHEPAAYICAAVVVVVGTYWAFTCEAAWLGRAGSVVVVIGVLLASSRKIDVLEEKVLDFMESHRRANPDEVRSELAKIKGAPPTDVEVAAVEHVIYESARSDITPLIAERRRVFKRHELVLIVAGTLINGFGECLLSSCSNMQRNQAVEWDAPTSGTLGLHYAGPRYINPRSLN